MTHFEDVYCMRKLLVRSLFIRKEKIQNKPGSFNPFNLEKTRQKDLDQSKMFTHASSQQKSSDDDSGLNVKRYTCAYNDRLKAVNESARKVALRAATSFSSSRIESNLFELFTCPVKSLSQA